MAKTTILIVLILSLAGCNDAVPQWVADSAAIHCGGADKIQQMFYDASTSSGSVNCKNGIFYSIQLQEDK